MRKLPAGYLKALGQIQATMSLAENGLLYTIHSLTKDDIKTTTSLVGGESLKFLASRISRIVHTRLKSDPDLLKEFDKALQKLRRLYDRRNEYTHSMWMWKSKKVFQLKYTRDWRDLVKRDPNITVDTLRTFLTDLETSTNRAMKLVADNIELLTK